MIGTLSEKYETGGRGPGTVSTGKGDAGGASYGSYQMTSQPNGGTVRRFLAWRDFPFRETFAGLSPGTASFTVAWKKLATEQPEAFHAAQHEFIKITHYDPLARKTKLRDGLDFETRSAALRDVIWSTAVQHGGATDVITAALAAVRIARTTPDFDRRLIEAIYAERGRKMADGRLARFLRNSDAVQKGVAKRFAAERAEALAMLARENAPAG